MDDLIFEHGRKSHPAWGFFPWPRHCDRSQTCGRPKGITNFLGPISMLGCSISIFHLTTTFSPPGGTLLARCPFPVALLASAVGTSVDVALASTTFNG
jgi:hypothetical protein